MKNVIADAPIINGLSYATANYRLHCHVQWKKVRAQKDTVDRPANIQNIVTHTHHTQHSTFLVDSSRNCEKKEVANVLCAARVCIFSVYGTTAVEKTAISAHFFTARSKYVKK